MSLNTPPSISKHLGLWTAPDKTFVYEQELYNLSST